MQFSFEGRVIHERVNLLQCSPSRPSCVPDGFFAHMASELPVHRLVNLCEELNSVSGNEYLNL